MSTRIFVIGDIHGCSLALHELLRGFGPKPDDTVVALGDFVDRGIDSQGVIELLISLESRCNFVGIKGNHDEMLLAARRSHSAYRRWLEHGGITTLQSYGDSLRMSSIPKRHFQFLERCRDYYETDTQFFTHASYDPALPLDQQDVATCDGVRSKTAFRLDTSPAKSPLWDTRRSGTSSTSAICLPSTLAAESVAC